MHQAVLDYLKEMSQRYPQVFKTKKVLECGSMYINGSVRSYFNAEEYIGIDWREGKFVDFVSLIHEYRDKPDGYFDTIISSSTIEHDPYWKESHQRMAELLAMGGSIVMTTPTIRGSVHCTETAPTEGYYKNILMTDVLYSILKHCWFELTIIDKRWQGNNFLFFHKKQRREYYPE